MAEPTTMAALVLGVIEGLTEFIPVSSTGHILLAGHFMDFKSAGKTFEVVIQLGRGVGGVVGLCGQAVGCVFHAPRMIRRHGGSSCRF